MTHQTSGEGLIKRNRKDFMKKCLTLPVSRCFVMSKECKFHDYRKANPCTLGRNTGYIGSLDLLERGCPLEEKKDE